MKTIFVAGFFRDRDVTLLRTLCEYFRVLMFPDEYWCQTVQSANLIFVEKPQITLSDKDFTYEMYTYLAFVEETGKRILPQAAHHPVHKDEMLAMYETARTSVELAEAFKQIATQEKIDMVIVSCDLTPERTPIVIEAKKLGIPTLDIEHGYSGAFLRHHTFIKGTQRIVPFISDFVNLDNILEQQLWQEYYAQTQRGGTMQFIVNGTPSDVSYDLSLTKERARLQLGLQQDALTICIAGTWHDMNNPLSPLRDLFEDVEAMLLVLRTIGEEFSNRKVQVVVKIHPAHATPDIAAEITEFLMAEAKNYGIHFLKIMSTNLNAVLSASDILISTAFSSVLWEGFMALLPAVLYISPNSWSGRNIQQDKVQQGNLLYEKDCIRFTTQAKEVAEALRFFSREENIRHFKSTAENIRRELHINEHTAVEKSRNICNWVANYLGLDIREKSAFKSTYASFPEPLLKGPETVHIATAKLRDADEAMAKGNISQAFALYQDVLSTEPQNEDALCALGHISHVAGLVNEANIFYSTVLKINPSNQKALEFLSRH
ncbi:MAG TPA: hypothetical protein VEC36_08285 [Patescibacteria group bacterium]|nr:hypothetical protein [Patescibacteria group bacterium]